MIRRASKHSADRVLTCLLTACLFPGVKQLSNRAEKYFRNCSGSGVGLPEERIKIGLHGAA